MEEVGVAALAVRPELRTVRSRLPDGAREGRAFGRIPYFELGCLSNTTTGISRVVFFW